MSRLNLKCPKIVVVGGINMNLIAATGRMPMPGETVTGDHFYTAPGGKGANQAVAAARMGALVHMVGKVGMDAFGAELVANLREEGIDVSAIGKDSDFASGISMILLDDVRQNYIVQVRGVNSNVDEEQVELARTALDSADAVMLQLELPFEVSHRIAKLARLAGVTVYWDPAPSSPDMDQALDAVDVIMPNQSEAEFLTGIAVTNHDSAVKAAQELLRKGVPSVVIKMAEMGAYYATAGDSGHVPGFEIEPVDSVAAGDAFGGALAVSLAQGLSLRESVERGCAAGAIAVTKQGAQSAMPTLAEVETLLAVTTR